MGGRGRRQFGRKILGDRRNGRRRSCLAHSWQFRRLFVIRAEFAQLLLPLLPFFCRGIQVISHIAEKLDLHDMNLRDGNAGNFGPGLVRVRVVVENCGD